MITQLKRCWNLDTYLKLCYLTFNWSVYPLISSTKSGPLPELETTQSLSGQNPTGPHGRYSLQIRHEDLYCILTMNLLPRQGFSKKCMILDGDPVKEYKVRRKFRLEQLWLKGCATLSCVALMLEVLTWPMLLAISIWVSLSVNISYLSSLTSFINIIVCCKVFFWLNFLSSKLSDQ